VAVSYMFLPEETYSDAACTNVPLKTPLPMSSFDITYYYSGHGLIPQGYNDPVKEGTNFALFVKGKGGAVSFKQFRKYFFQNCKAPPTVRKMQLKHHNPEAIYAAFLDGEGAQPTKELLQNGMLTVAHVQAASLNVKMGLVFGLDEGIEEINYGDHFKYDYPPPSFTDRATKNIEVILAREGLGGAQQQLQRDEV